MNARQKQLLTLLLNESDYKSTSDFAEQLQCSIRTAYHDFHEIEQYLQTFGFSLDKKQGLGTRLAINHQERMDILRKVNGPTSFLDRFSIKNRQKWIALKLLSHDGYLSMQHLADECYVSKTAIAHDIGEIEKWFEAAGVKVERNHTGIKTQGRERDIRSVIAELVSKPAAKDWHGRQGRTNTRLDEMSYCHFAEWFSAETVDHAETVLDRLEKLNHITISDLYYTNILTHLLILIQRTRQGRRSDFSVTSVPGNKPILKNWTEQIIRLLREYTSITVPANEAGYIALYMLHSTGRQSNDLLLDQETEKALDKVIQRMVEMFSRVLEIDIRGDKQLKNGLKLHIVPMLERLHNDLNLKNPMLPYIKSHYYSIFGMTWLITSDLENKFHIRLNDDEVGYITIHFLTALERRNRKKPKRVIITCYGGVGTSQFLANRIQNTIPEIDIVAVVPSYKLHQFDLDTFDFIIAAEPISFQKKPVVEVSPILDEQDVITINQYMYDNYGIHGIQKNSENTFSQGSKSILSQLIDPNLIFIREKARHKQEIIHFLCDAANKKGFVDSQFEKSVLKRESISPTSVGNGIAIPHGDERYIKSSQIIMFLSKRPIDWGNENVSLIFLIVIKTTEGNHFQHAMRDLYGTLKNDSLMKQFKQITSPTDAYKLLVNHINEGSKSSWK